MTTVIHATETGERCEHWWAYGDPFICDQCKRKCCRCMGADDEFPELCCDCWGAKQAVARVQFTDSPSKPETYKRQPATSGKLPEGPPACEVAAMEAPSRSRGEAPTGGALIGYRHNPCCKCGEHVSTLGATLCLTCLCRALDGAGVVLKIKDFGAEDGQKTSSSTAQPGNDGRATTLVHLPTGDGPSYTNQVVSAPGNVAVREPSSAPITTYPLGIREFATPEGATFGRF